MPNVIRRLFGDTDGDMPWLIIEARQELEFLPGAKSQMASLAEICSEA